MSTLFERLLVAHLFALSIFMVVVKEVLRSHGLRSSLWPWPSIRDLGYLDKLVNREQNASRRRRFWWFRASVYCAIASFAIVPLILSLVLR
jgi:hypothetical protein